MTKRDDIETLLTQIRVEAIMTGLIPESVKLGYWPGSVQNGRAPFVGVVSGPNVSVDWLPTFTRKDTSTDVDRLLTATWTVLKAIRINRGK